MSADRTLAARVYESTARPELWNSLPTELQDLVVEIVAAAIEIYDRDGRPCAKCGRPVEDEDWTCPDCYLEAHAETCHTCQSEIPMAQQRCTSCVVDLVRTELRALEVGAAAIEAVIKILEQKAQS